MKVSCLDNRLCSGTANANTQGVTHGPTEHLLELRFDLEMVVQEFLCQPMVLPCARTKVCGFMVKLVCMG
jgi:hypothetical protein